MKIPQPIKIKTCKSEKEKSRHSNRMAVQDITIVMPCIDRANFVALILHALAENSYHRLHVLIVNGTRHRNSDHVYYDYFHDLETGKPEQKYGTIQEFCDANPKVCDKLNLQLFDVTEDVDQWRTSYERGLVYPGMAYADGADIAYKNNYVLELVDTPWYIGDWDDDFYPAKDWDKHLLDLAEKYPRMTVFTPRHVQPFRQAQIDSMEASGARQYYGNPWFASTCIYENKAYVTAAQWEAYCMQYGSDDVIEEPCSQRTLCHYSPLLFRTSEFMDHIQAWSHQGTGYELRMDNHCAEMGFQKVSPCRSFLLHKGHIPYAGSAL